MTIKEVETRTGLARANIRYYEDQGFFSAARGENGYRNYSEADIDTLLKVKLLRQLGFSLEDILGLQNGEQLLGSALERRMSGLDAERRVLDRAAQLCREMHSDGAEFYTLDARRYLDRLAQGEQEKILVQDRDPVRFFPWRRYFARTLDLLLCTTLVTVVLQLTVRLNLLRSVTFFLRLGGLVLMLGTETVLLHFFGTTPGKALLGLNVLREDGSKLSFEQSARRTGQVTAFFGGSVLLMDLGVPLLDLIGIAIQVWACWQVYHERPLFWETDQLYLDGSTREQSFWEKRGSWLRTAGYLAAGAACLGLMVGGHFWAARPLHPDKTLTVEEFVENYNQYMFFTYGEENLSKRLTTDGTFENIQHDGNNVVIDLDDLFARGAPPELRFYFEEAGGVLTQVTLSRQYESSGAAEEDQNYFTSVPYREAYAAMRALLWGRLGGRGVDQAYDALLQQKGNYHTDLDGVSIDSEMRFDGYYVADDGSTVIPQGGQKQRYDVSFVMAVTE